MTTRNPYHWLALATIFWVLMFTAGCTTTAAYKPSTVEIAQVRPENRLPGKLFIYTTSKDDEFIYEGAGKSITSTGHSMRVPFGKMVKLLAGDVYGKLFDSGYDLGNTIPSGSVYDLIIRPRVGEFEYRFNQAKNAGTAITTQVNMSLQIEVIDVTGKKLFERTYESGNGVWYPSSSDKLHGPEAGRESRRTRSGRLLLAAGRSKISIQPAPEERQGLVPRCVMSDAAP